MQKESFIRDKKCDVCRSPVHYKSRTFKCHKCARKLGKQPLGKLTTVRNLTECQSAWVGAMIEGEGSVTQVKDSNRIKISVYNTDVEIISTLLRFVGEGRISVDKRSSKNKLCWHWSMHKKISIVKLAKQITPWMTFKGDKLRSLIKNYD